MKKMLSSMVLVSGLMAFGAFGGDLQDAAMVNTNAVTTNALTGEISSSGEIKLMRIDVSNDNPFVLTITEQATGTVIYTNSALAADAVLVPRLVATTTTGASAYSGTNVIYTAVNCLGLTYRAVATSNSANTVTIKCITDKNP